MDDKRKWAYIKLIQTLLSCPQSQEQELLQQHPDLLDDGLIQGMKFFAEMLYQQGQENKAARLERVSVQLAQTIGMQKTSSPRSNVPDGLWIILQELDRIGGDMRCVSKRVALCRQALELVSRRKDEKRWAELKG
ncbi:MAG: hypothetical protein DCF25_21835 [Leptolyngbya foveolarum]|uniref:Uncharacterized protein n=1 Tax=Leptolyngbya foveolarum TaxID=47253 RepID=A0A2W4VB66_9CYAN|nr:MAG: hypothetical protein DCF25_21835 [Leptolyngbya foveolarum]